MWPEKGKESLSIYTDIALFVTPKLDKPENTQKVY